MWVFGRDNVISSSNSCFQIDEHTNHTRSSPPNLTASDKNAVSCKILNTDDVGDEQNFSCQVLVLRISRYFWLTLLDFIPQLRQCDRIQTLHYSKHKSFFHLINTIWTSEYPTLAINPSLYRPTRTRSHVCSLTATNHRHASP